MSNLGELKRLYAVFIFETAIVAALPAQTFTSTLIFNGYDGASPEYGALTQGKDGNLYGTTLYGGPNQGGTIFRVTPGGTLTTLDSFNIIPSTTPQLLNNGLIQANDGNFYGTSQAGGDTHNGTIFKFTPSGVLTILHSFTGNLDGYGPMAGLLQSKDGNLYGTTEGGGANHGGTVFKITLSGILTTLSSFDGNNLWGAAGGVIQATDGNFYGTTENGGGIHGAGTVFKVTSGGAWTILHTFNGTPDGAYPLAGLVQGTDGNLYGTTSSGGASDNGTIFKITTAGVLSILYSFNASGSDGAYPRYSTLIQASDGNFYGTTAAGGANHLGAIFRITPQGVYTALHSFGGTDGATPYGGLVQATDGKVHGTASGPGNGTFGAIFSLTLPPSTAPPAPTISSVVNGASFAGPVTPGSWLTIFGSNLAPTGDVRPWNAATEILSGKLPTNLDGTSVTVNGKSAAVAFISPAQINVQAPDDSALGPVQVTVSTAVGGQSVPLTANYAQFAPALFPAGNRYIAAQHSDNSYVGAYAGASPAKPGEVIVLWGTGFGPASPPVPSGQAFFGANKLANPLAVTIGGQPAAIDFAGIVGAGLVQINVHVPSSINNGDAGVVATVGAVSTQATANLISVHN